MLLSVGWNFFLTLWRTCVDIFASVVAPPVCAHCVSFLPMRQVFCNSCAIAIVPLASKTVIVTKKYQVPVLSVGEYTDPLKRLVLAKGWSDIVASYELGRLIADFVSRSSLQCDYIVPVPLHWSRYAWRGYNQAEVMARVLSEKIQVPVVNLVCRGQATSLQSSVNYIEREYNVRNSFCLMGGDLSVYKNKRILIVDDVMTTGATIRSVAKVITRLNPTSLVGMVAARVK